MLKSKIVPSLLVLLISSTGWSANMKVKEEIVANPVVPEELPQSQVVSSIQSYAIPWSSLTVGGNLNMSSASFGLKATVGQPALGNSYSASYRMGSGLWYGITGTVDPSCAAKPGDANGDNTYTLADVIAIVNYIFKKAGWPACSDNNYTCWLHALTCRGDWNAIDGVNLADVIRAVNYIFKKTGWPFCPANNYTCWLPPVSGVCCLPVP